MPSGSLPGIFATASTARCGCPDALKLRGVGRMTPTARSGGRSLTGPPTIKSSMPQATSSVRFDIAMRGSIPPERRRHEAGRHHHIAHSARHSRARTAIALGYVVIKRKKKTIASGPATGIDIAITRVIEIQHSIRDEVSLPLLI